ncbi:MAG: endoribonuclease [Snowella sp.]|nr:MAG: endoribonuclease [Snowella sp.]
MIEKDDIEQTLQELENIYDLAIERGDSQKILVFYSKLAILELCGWIEESLDIIILDYAENKLKNRNNQKYIEDLVKRNYGFDYENNFRKMLIQMIGLIFVEKLEHNLEERGSIITQFKSELGSLKNTRNSAAHTHISEILPIYDAPSITKRNFQRIYQLLIDIEAELKTL